MPEGSFSLRELQAAAEVDPSDLKELTAGDGVTLTYRRYVPASPRAALLFYHGGGAHSGAGYQHLGRGLQRHYGTVVYTPDLRGHGASGGPRGDAPSPEQVWADITTFIARIRAEWPQLPVVLGGHSSGAGLALNYASRADHEPVDGYAFLSPQLGARAQIDRPSLAAPFVAVDASAFAAYAASGGSAHGHDHAVRFNYPTQLLAADPGLVSSITVTMSVALTPTAPGEQFAALDRPLGLWIGSDDELFLPDRVLAFADLAAAADARSEADMIPGGRHLSVLVTAHETIGPWITRLVGGVDP